MLIRFITLSKASRKILVAVAVLIGVSYPFLVYFGLSVFSPATLIFGILTLLGVRVLILKSTLPRRLLTSKSTLKPFHIWPAILAIVIMGIGAFFHSEIAVRIYPVVISLSLGAVFLVSIFYPPTIIERIARISEPDLGISGQIYTRKVTIIWVCFFAINASIAAWTAFYGTIEQWTLYNGFISYCLTGVLLGGEMIVRRFVRKNEVDG